MEVIEPRSGVGMQLMAGDRLKVIDLEGTQVADLFCANSEDAQEQLSSGRTIDYNESIRICSGTILYSSKSRAMLKVVSDSVESHDFLLTPCSADTFRKMYEGLSPHPGCEGNLAKALFDIGVEVSTFPATFNIFMNVKIDSSSGAINIDPPLSKKGDSIVLEALMDLKVGLTACSAPNSNGGTCTSIGYQILRKTPPPKT